MAKVVAGFQILVLRVSPRDLIAYHDVFPSELSRRKFMRLVREQGGNPRVTERVRCPN